MILELSQLPTIVQQQIQAKALLEIVNNGKVVAILNPTSESIAKKADFELLQESTKQQSLHNVSANTEQSMSQNALEYFASLDYPAEVGDIEFELPPRTISNRPTAFEND